MRDLDFDVEWMDLGNAASLARRFKAIARIQAAGEKADKPVNVSLTLPVMPTGLPRRALRVVRAAVRNGTGWPS